ncbi:hypothetical protein LEP1GSC173_0090 [Leptospira interrogans str. HAI1594]|nr:hypothetical protein LEP1GSC080_1389 [Leptospira interrogans str. FPW2026]EKO88712.1 hypothetical protein LEP1GSC009_0525 [Leptospira interrogans serovar Grippotyphosa str. Andaman]EKP75002.1 hypothetical protein LEP1GSC173_0090 [Leptospira interrogans str. HAI1594]EMJ53381.1 hypothetical protein LEP1GSC111_3784 [Leptospira interrogans str. UT126]EMJ60058.1 hypothetical protein LEP1GSC197_4000 [Leptospira interrogans serovar Pomona str. CSL4002]EMK19029.1 hypothetical protein LEP1GSC075_204
MFSQCVQLLDTSRRTFRLRIENDFHYIFLSTLTVNFILFFWTSFRSRILQKEGKNLL